MSNLGTRPSPSLWTFNDVYPLSGRRGLLTFVYTRLMRFWAGIQCNKRSNLYGKVCF